MALQVLDSTNRRHFHVEKPSKDFFWTLQSFSQLSSSTAMRALRCSSIITSLPVSRPQVVKNLHFKAKSSHYIFIVIENLDIFQNTISETVLGTGRVFSNIF